jgi:ribosome production factor 1
VILSSSGGIGSVPQIIELFIYSLPHRYAFRSPEKVALQEIGPRFTLKLRWLKKGIPAVYNYGEPCQPLPLDSSQAGEEDSPSATDEQHSDRKTEVTVPPKQDEFIWQWKVCLQSTPLNSLSDLVALQPDLETSRKTFFL